MTTEIVSPVTAPAIIDRKLVLPEKTGSLTIADYMPVLRKYQGINNTMFFDYRDKKGNTAARSHVAKLRKIKAPIGEIHKRLKAEYLAITTKMDADKNEALSIIETMIEHHDKELKIVAAEEAAEAQRKEDERHLEACWDLAHEMNDMFDQRRELDRKAADQERIAAEQAESARQLQIEADKKAAADRAAEEARLAERARSAQRIKDIEEAAEREFQQASERERLAKEAADKKVKEAEEAAKMSAAAAELAQEEARRLSELEKKQDEERRRAEEAEARANSENVQSIHLAIIEALEAHGIDRTTGQTLCELVRSGVIPAMAIDYQWVDVPGFVF